MSFELSDAELWHAYRRAKSDCRYERVQNGARDFATYEHDLSERLESFAVRVKQGPNALFPTAESAGTTFWLLKQSAGADPPSNHVIVDPNARWDASSPHELAFRPVCKPSVDAQLLSSLWLMRVGARIDKQLGSTCFGNRLRRTYPSGEVNLTAHSSFQHYARRYQAWRDRALSTADHHLTSSGSATILTFDIKNCYPSLHCQNVFDKLQNELGSDPLTDCLKTCIGHLNGLIGTDGLPIGLTASAVLANYCLSDIDGWFAQSPLVHYYGRYVDDFAIVLPTQLASSPSVLLSTLQTASGGMVTAGDVGDWRIRLPNSGLRVEVSAGKTRLIQLSGATGKAMISSIRRDGGLVASEWRLLPKAIGFSATARKLLRSPFRGRLIPRG